MAKTHNSYFVAEDPQLAQQAQAQFNAGKYKKAIELYKKLLKQDDNSNWRLRLSHCYLERAKEFAGKGMIKEALVLWENYCQQAQAPYEEYDQYLLWLIETGNQPKIQSVLEQLTATQLDKDYPKLAAVLGKQLLSGVDDMASSLPQDSIFINHYRLAKAALLAYQGDDAKAMNEALQQLPYRSVFRDFRNLLKAETTAVDEPAETQKLLEKIPSDSPYSSVAQLLLATRLKGFDLARALVSFSRALRCVVGEIAGLDDKQMELIESLSKQKDRLNDKAKFNLALRFKSLFGHDATRNFCFAVLTDYPAGRKDYIKTFGKIDPFQENRLKALDQERQDNFHKSNHYWRLSIDALKQQGDENNLKIALILRHLATFQAPEGQIATLIESLEYDPDDKDSYCQILQHFQQVNPDDKQHHHWLTRAIDLFPQDIELLTLACESASQRGAFTKAIRFATKIREIDPVNTRAKQLLFANHLNHARLLMQGKKYHLVEAAIHQAETLKIGKDSSFQTQLARALLHFASQDKQQGLQQIAEVLNELHSLPILMHFHAAMEAQLCGLPVATILRALPIPKEEQLSSQELTRLNAAICQYAGAFSHRELVHKALAKIKTPLKKSLLEQDYDEKLLLELCQTLDKIEHFELLRHCTKQAHGKWKKPIWIYYNIYAQTNGDPERLSYAQRMTLELNLGDARKANEHRAMVLIDKYLQRYYEKHPPVGLDVLGSLFSSDDEYDDPFEDLFGHLPADVFERIDKKADVLARKMSPEKLVQSIINSTGGHRSLLIAMMQDPDIFSVLLMLKAADSLGIDTGVSVEDVLDWFGIVEQSDSTPFPF